MTYAALILHDDGIPVTADKLSSIAKAAGVTVEPYWPGLFAKFLESKDMGDLIGNVGSGAWLPPAETRADRAPPTRQGRVGHTRAAQKRVKLVNMRAVAATTVQHAGGLGARRRKSESGLGFRRPSCRAGEAVGWASGRRATSKAECEPCGLSWANRSPSTLTRSSGALRFFPPPSSADVCSPPGVVRIRETPLPLCRDAAMPFPAGAQPGFPYGSPQRRSGAAGFGHAGACSQVDRTLRLNSGKLVAQGEQRGENGSTRGQED
jgi:large subunit ribosomal protein LP1